MTISAFSSLCNSLHENNGKYICKYHSDLLVTIAPCTINNLARSTLLCKHASIKGVFPSKYKGNNKTRISF